jgi:Uncharacterized conserved protein
MSQQLKVVPVLIPTMLLDKYKMYDNVLACTPDKLFELIGPQLSNRRQIDIQEWINAEYCPLPSLVDAARLLYKNEDLPYIRKANSAGIPEAVSALKKISNEACENGNRVLALVTGVPGAGKTLLGLDFVHQSQSSEHNKSEAFLSGNGPLVEVLQYALKSKTFVAPLRNYIKEYGIHKKGIPIEHIVVFDEAQRSWDKEHVLEKHNVNQSEPELIISIADTMPHWAMLLGLVGEGQEIHNGEEAGIVQWKDAISCSDNKWKVVCPPKLSNMFENICEVIPLDCLDLNVSLRSHIADDVASWVNSLLSGDIDTAAKLGLQVQSQGFRMYITRDLDRAKRYCRNRYEKSPDNRYGLIASSKANILTTFGVKNDFASTQNLRVGPWYNEGLDSPLSCCQLRTVVTEFSCQGLELDMPILCWGEDLTWQNEGWVKYVKPAKCKDPHQLRLNSYRVLLTRGRDGFVIYMPEDGKLDETYKVMLRTGIKTM